MKIDWKDLEQFRQNNHGTLWCSVAGDTFGAFVIPCGKTSLQIIASSGDEQIPWEHVSIHARDYLGMRTPTWKEMCFVKDLFWEVEETVIQYHPPRSLYVNNHPHVLHLWKPIGLEVTLPPTIAVGIKT